MPEFIPTPFEMIILNSPPRYLNEILKKERNRIRIRKYYNENIEKERKRGKKYRSENVEKEKERQKNYRLNNSEKVKESSKKYRLNNKEKVNDRKKKWKANNPEKLSKQVTKDNWRRKGVNMECFEEFYELYISTTHCDFCNVELTDGKKMSLTTKCLDHSHVSGELRNILCNKCNLGLPKHT